MAVTVVSSIGKNRISTTSRIASSKSFSFFSKLIREINQKYLDLFLVLPWGEIIVTKFKESPKIEKVDKHSTFPRNSTFSLNPQGKIDLELTW